MTPARQALAHWFAEVWTILDPPAGVHLRRLHYRFVSLPQGERPPKLNGEPYENTEGDWKILGGAATDARALGLVDAALFTDRRAGEPSFVANDSGQDAEAWIHCYGAELDSPPHETSFAFSYRPTSYSFPTLPSAHIIPPKVAEPYSIEIWAEKSTMNDVLEPLVRRLNATLITGVGELSFTHCLWHVNRVLEHRKPTRLVYVSDHDPAGDHMPISVARKIEFLLRRDGHEFDIRLEPLVLTREQVEYYRLPRIPIKDSDKGKRNFEERHGQGAVELDALEALHPGELRSIVEAAIDRYRSPARQAGQENNTIAADARDEIREVRDTVSEEFDSEIAALRADFEDMGAEIGPHQDALAAIAEDASERSQAHVDAINARVAAFHERASDLWARIGAKIRERIPDADDFDWAHPDGADESDDPLFDSTRSYLDQIDRFKQHLGQPTTWRRRSAKKQEEP